jgi:hypothetical protein
MGVLLILAIAATFFYIIRLNISTISKMKAICTNEKKVK